MTRQADEQTRRTARALRVRALRRLSTTTTLPRADAPDHHVIELLRVLGQIRRLEGYGLDVTRVQRF